MNELTVVVDVDYWQFYLKDAAGDWPGDQFEDSDYLAGLGVLDGLVWVGSARHFGEVTVSVMVLDAEPTTLPDACQHAVEVSLTSTGTLEVYSWGELEPAASLPVPVGPVRLRACWQGMVFPFEYVDDFPATESVMFQVWQAPLADRTILRRCPDWK
jgi:hypothetical protein